MKPLFIALFVLCLAAPPKKSFYRVGIDLEVKSLSDPYVRAKGTQEAKVYLINKTDTLFRTGTSEIVFEDLDIGSTWTLLVKHEGYRDTTKQITVLKDPIYDAIILSNGKPIIVP